MGLDMFAYITKEPILSVDFEMPSEAVEIAYWRKHHNLHGWMESLYRVKGGSSVEFNCVPVKLSLADINALQSALESLSETSGIAFDESRIQKSKTDEDFIRKARLALRQDYQVFYTSWW